MLSRLFQVLISSLMIVLNVEAAQNQLQQVSNYGSNPTNVQMYIYKPTGLITNPALIVALHWCNGNAQSIFTGTQFANLADQYKSFMVLYPNAPDSGGCWDVHTTATLTHDAGGDSLGIASQVRYAIQNYGVDKSRVFMTGLSSGAMMISVLAGAYPDLFTAGSAFAGVPYACFAGSSMWNSQCSTGQTSKTPQQWGDLVRSGYPGYSGTRPKIQIFQGTSDTVLSYNNFGENIKQWTNVFGYSTTPVTTQSNSPLNGWTRSTYGPNFQAINAQGVTHDIPIQHADALNWFGITGGGGTTSPTSVPTSTPTSPPSSTPSSTPPATTTTTANAPTQTHYGQCAGLTYKGPTTCEAPYTCKYLSDYYSQCV
ncbi:acetyl xylan esterase [Crepidotus variabilis]|uniref:Carboxylic ester hydrolase n=1 Tax=Crepidotus variabilis TaxID=179855 RepID=A0A9P6E6F0_9AGAR|nr:acetyl xylan esterase [Crepidotus variabilis]